MKIINLKDHYPFLYENDIYIEVPDSIANVLFEVERAERAYTARVNYHKAYYSLDRNDGIEKASLRLAPSSEEQVIEKMNRRILYSAILRLPEKQAHRLYAHYFLGLSIKEIARQERVNSCTVSNSLNRALKNVKKYLPKGETF